MDLLFVLIVGLITLAALDRGEAAARSRAQPVRVMRRASQPHGASQGRPITPR